MLDSLAGWGMRPPVVVADAAYGTVPGDWHHHVPLVTAAHAFLTEQRLHAGWPVVCLAYDLGSDYR
ncbi:hypothetical protein ACFYO0_09425 [Streptomyces sp. NPDC006365]|uniref:hypothetical protein n=1 Tax=Streptomyces sp. NPDC006365 TaxID=3364744 RepID=UPI0036C40C65